MSQPSTSTVPSPVDGTPARNGQLRVLHVIGRLSEVGGAERFAVGLATHLPQERFSSWMCAPRGADELPKAALASAGIPLVTLGRNAKWDVHRMGQLASLMRRERFDIVHAHLFGSNLWSTVIGRACRVPVLIAHEHTWAYQGNSVRSFLDGRLIGRIATRFIAVSAADANRMVEIEGVPAAKVVYIPSAYVPRALKPAGDLRAELGLAPDTPLVGTAAVLRPQKALHVLLEAHARVRTQVPDTHLVVAGDGECRQSLERRAAELGISSSVHFLGQRGDVEAILATVDVAAMSSAFEGTPLFAFEAMTMGTPLVATAVGGLPEIIADDHTGVLVAPGSAEGLATAIVGLLRDPERRTRIGAAARSAVQAYSIGTITERFVDLYEQLIGEAREKGAGLR